MVMFFFCNLIYLKQKLLMLKDARWVWIVPSLHRIDIYQVYVYVKEKPTRCNK